MPYASESEMIERFGATELAQLTDRAVPAANDIDSAVLARALADADGVIDSHLGAVYAVPLAAPLPADIVRIACDIARCLLHDLAAPEQVRKHYDDALRWLRDLAAGKLSLIGSGGAIVAKRADASAPGVVRGYSDNGTFGAGFAAAWLP